MIPHRLLIRRRHLISRPGVTRPRLRLHEALLLARKLRIRRAIHRPIALAAADWRVPGLRVHVVVRHAALLGIFGGEGEVGRIRGDGDDVPGVQEAGEEPETWRHALLARRVIGWGGKGRDRTAEADVDDAVG